MQVSGVEITEADLDWLRQQGGQACGLSRTQLSREFCNRKGLVNGRGRRREVTARVILGRLAQRGVIELPASRGAIVRTTQEVPCALPEGVYSGSATQCGELSEVEILPVDRRDGTRHAQWLALMNSSHSLGAGPLCGAQLRYLVRCGEGLLGALAFSASAWRLAARDQWIGWSEAARQHHLARVIANSRFLLVVRIKNLASHVLAKCLERLPSDWEDRYGYRPLLVETFVDPTRSGACYIAAGWISIGQTTGRGRQDRTRSAPGPAKKILVKSLDPDARAKLCLEPIRTPAPDEDWAYTELGCAKLPDERLGKRLLTIARDFYARPTANIPEACEDRAKTKAAYRFFSHNEVTMEAILEPHYEATLARAAKESVILSVQDTTFLNYTMHQHVTGLGPIGSCGAKETLGLVAHGTLLFNTQGTPLGLLDMQCWARDPEAYGKSEERQRLPTVNKESNKWLVGFEATAKAQQRLPGTRFVCVADREADVFDLIQRAGQGQDQPALLVRAKQPRKIVLADGSTEPLWDTIRALPSMGTLPLSVPRSGKRPRRETQLDLRFQEVLLRAPKKNPGHPSVKVWAIAATETHAPEEGDPIEWLLLTTLPVTTLEEAAEKLDWYTQRWQIEVYHRTLKSGCRLENRRLADADDLKACIAVDMIVAWRIFHLTKLGREVPNVPCTVFFEDAEWKALVAFVKRIPPPSTPPTLREAIRMVAGLGGFLGRKSDGEPGTKSLWIGLMRLDDIAVACAVGAALFRAEAILNDSS